MTVAFLEGSEYEHATKAQADKKLRAWAWLSCASSLTVVVVVDSKQYHVPVESFVSDSIDPLAMSAQTAEQWARKLHTLAYQLEHMHDDPQSS